MNFLKDSSDLKGNVLTAFDERQITAQLADTGKLNDSTLAQCHAIQRLLQETLG